MSLHIVHSELTAVNAPHNFLHINDSFKEKVTSREWIMARIAKTDEAVAGDVSSALGTGPLRHH
jgi:hypothetical protein